MDLRALAPTLTRIRNVSLILGLLIILACAIGAIADPGAFFQAYLISYWFWMQITLGCLAIKMIHHLTAGSWGVAVRPLLVAATRTLPLMAILTLPLFFGLHILYPWAQHARMAADPVLAMQHLGYLNVPFLAARMALCFVVWIGLAHVLNRWSQQAEGSDATPLGRQLQLVSALGLVLYAVTQTSFAIDWLMALEARWYSTIWGMITAMDQIAAAFAFLLVASWLLRRHRPLQRVFLPHVSQDLANLTLGFMLLWIYTTFDQYMIIWAGNLPPEITWYLHRTEQGWQAVAWVVVGLHFFLPFCVLLSRTLKRHSGAMALVGGMILFGTLLEAWWFVVPSLHPLGVALDWLDLMPVGLGGLWLASFCLELLAPIQVGQTAALEGSLA